MSENRRNFTIVPKQVNTFRVFHRRKQPSKRSHIQQMRQIWYAMIDRCYNQTNEAYARYGGRGISVCAEWRNSFEAFLDDMGHRPSMFHSVERKDNASSYCPVNCIWGTPGQQTRNKRSNVMVTYKGETLVLTDLANKYRLNYGTLYTRIVKYGWPVERAVEQKSKHPNLIVYDGTEFSLRGLARHLQVHLGTVLDRLKRNLSLEEAFTGKKRVPEADRTDLG